MLKLRDVPSLGSRMRIHRTHPISPGFTLIELLVVVAIIAILAGLLLPALSRARQASDSILCKSNVKQIALGLAMYTSDFGSYPPSFAAKDVLWVDLLEPYTKSKWPTDVTLVRDSTSVKRRSIYACPGYSRMPGAYLSRGGLSSGLSGSYGINGRGVGPSDKSLGLFETSLGIFRAPGEADTLTLKEGAVVNPSDMVALGDSVLLKYAGDTLYRGLPLIDEGIRLSDHTVLRPSAQKSAKDRLYSRRHAGKWTIAFCDGHVETLRATEIFDFRKPQILRRWNRDNLPHQELLPPAIYYE